MRFPVRQWRAIAYCVGTWPLFIGSNKKFLVIFVLKTVRSILR